MLFCLFWIKAAFHPRQGVGHQLFLPHGRFLFMTSPPTWEGRKCGSCIWSDSSHDAGDGAGLTASNVHVPGACSASKLVAVTRPLAWRQGDFQQLGHLRLGKGLATRMWAVGALLPSPEVGADEDVCVTSRKQPGSVSGIKCLANSCTT